VTNNRDIYYLRDAMGGHTGLLMDDDDNPSTPSRASFATYDAFGNGMSASPLPEGGPQGGGSALAGSFSWRGAEGSVYDTAPNLVYMQARHYDPTIGRFIQPDTLAIASMTTQGMNRYTYCENDPVNATDPTGLISASQVLGLIAGIGMIVAGAFAMYFGALIQGLAMISAGIGTLLLTLATMTTNCALRKTLAGLGTAFLFLAFSLATGGISGVYSGLIPQVAEGASLALELGGVSGLLGAGSIYGGLDLLLSDWP